MRKHIKIFSLFIIFGISLVLLGCGNPIELAAPVISLEGTTVSWDEIEYASNYKIVINEDEHNIVASTYDLKDLLEGEYTIKVYSIGDGTLFTNSKASNIITYTKGGLVSLAAPVIKLDDAIVSWEEVANASKYKVVVNAEEYEVEVTSYELIDLQDGEYNVKVYAIGNGTTYTDSPASNEVTYVKAALVSLAAPVIKLEETILSWDEVANASKYKVVVNAEEYVIETTSYDLKDLKLENYEITVIALGDNLKYLTSEHSNKINITPTNLVEISAGVSTDEFTQYIVEVQSSKDVLGFEINIKFDEEVVTITEENVKVNDILPEGWLYSVNIVDGKIRFAITGLEPFNVRLVQSLITLDFVSVDTPHVVSIDSYIIDNGK